MNSFFSYFREEFSKPGVYGSRANELMSTVKSQSIGDDEFPVLDEQSIGQVQEV